ncbi:MAG: AI-2E family transporter [Microscillaceae bacterium]|nr:AI-2E family transporter [Microscillaceae bacterium]
MQDQKAHLPLHIHLSIGIVGLLAFFYILTLAGGILIPLAFALLFSLFLYPLCRWLERRGLARSLAIALCLSLIVLFLTVILSLIYENLLTFANDMPQMRRRSLRLIDQTQALIEQRFQMDEQKQLAWLNENLSYFVNAGGNFLNTFVSSATTFFTYALLIPIYVFFMMYYRHVFKEFVNRVVHPDYLDNAVLIEEQILSVVQKYISGLFTVIAIVGVLNIGGLWLIGIPHALFFGALAAILVILPYIGNLIGSLLPAVYALVMTDSFFYPVAVILWFQIVQAIEGNFITPNIVGSQVNLNPLVAIIALLTGAALWGIPGMILFTPLMAMLKVLLDNVPSLAPYGYLLSEGEKKSTRPARLAVEKKRAFWHLWGRKKMHKSPLKHPESLENP